jgi:UDP-glucose 4-epimerase
MKTICIVGASGYIGSFLARYFQAIGYQVIGTYRRLLEDDMRLIDIEWVQGDVTDSFFIEKLGKMDFQYLVYCVSLNHSESEKNFDISLKVNFFPIVKICEILAKKKNFERLIYFSTMQVFGQIQSGAVIDNFTKVAPANVYGLTHLMCEQVISYFGRKWCVNATSVRLSNAYGAPTFKSNDCWWLVVNDLCMSVLRNKVIELTSDGRPQRDFIHLQDVAGSVLYILESSHKFPSTLNLCSGKTYTILELANIVAEVYKDLYDKDVEIKLPPGSSSISLEELAKIEFVPGEGIKNKSTSTDLKAGVKSLLMHIQDNFLLGED